jgi:hypothetical protein
VTFFLDDVAGARIPASRLRGILENVQAGRPLTAQQEAFLRQKGYIALAQMTCGALAWTDFVERAAKEQKIRRDAVAAANERNAVERAFQAEVTKRKNEIQAEATKRKNAILFAKQAQKEDRRRKLRELPDRFNLPFVERHDLRRVNHILRYVVAGQPIEKDDLVWLASDDAYYWTDELRQAHHANMATILTAAWRQTGDLWSAINACGHWRKAGSSEKGLTLVETALNHKKAKGKTRSALLTTGGGALRDLGRREDAVAFGTEAHALTETDFRPCTLLGAVYIEIGDYDMGAAWYEKAEARGASKKAIDRELESILQAASHHERHQIRNALKAYNPARYERI